MIESGGAADIAAKSAVPGWVLLLGALGIVIGLATYGYKVIATIGKEITELTPSRGFAAELATATTVVGASAIGLPVSTTHTLVGAVLGIGIARGIGALNLGVVGSIFMSWLITLPAGAASRDRLFHRAQVHLYLSRADAIDARLGRAFSLRVPPSRVSCFTAPSFRSHHGRSPVPIPSLKEQFAALIAAPSVSCTQPGWDQSNRPVIELLAAWLGELGFACETPEVAPGKFNLLASYGSGPGGLVLAGHSDTVPFDGELWTADPLRLREADDCWYGLGSCDMKGFFALVIEAVRPLLEQPFRRPLLILATCDESSMSGARAWPQPASRSAAHLSANPRGCGRCVCTRAS